ncbi:hypothetical protein ScPMuIL_018067, partial [Solemya velum]
LLGHLSFASRVILPGRSFVSHLIRLSTTVRQLHHHVRLNKQCQSDILMWREFLHNWNGVSMFYECHITKAADMELYTDAASTLGFGGYFRHKWFSSSWPPELLERLDSSQGISMSFMELYPIVVSAIFWGDEWKTKKVLFHCDNLGTVQIIQKGRSKSPLIMTLMRCLILCSIRNNFYGLPPISEDILIYFVAHCFQILHIQYSTIKLYLCGLRFHYRRQGQNPLVTQAGLPLPRLASILQGIKKLQGKRRPH